jgi:hypothetical protein
MDTCAKHELEFCHTLNIGRKFGIIFIYVVNLCPMGRSTPMLASP